MTASAAIVATLPKAVRAARSALRRDRSNAYALDEPWTLPPLGGDLPRLGLMPPDYEDEAWVIRAGTVTELPFALDPANCDGCTLAPDVFPRSFGGLRAYVGAIFHDRWYKWQERFAAAWGWARARVRRLGDIIFHSILRALARRLRGFRRAGALALCRVYYRGVRAFGGVAHDVMKDTTSSPGGGGGISPHSSTSLAPVALAGLLLFAAGCSGGCSPIPLAWEEGAGIDVPAHSYTNTVTGEHFETRSRGDAETPAPEDLNTEGTEDTEPSAQPSAAPRLCVEREAE